MKKDVLFLEQSEGVNTHSLEEAKKVSKEIKVSTINIKKNEKCITIFYEDNFIVEDLINTLMESIKLLLKDLKINKNNKVLFIGLGNKELSVDKLGYLTIEKLSVNNNSYKIYKEINIKDNIDTISFIKAIKNLLEVDLVIIIDSLKATSEERIGKTIQLSTSIININGELLSKKTIKCPIITIGVPLTINTDKEKLLLTTANVDTLVDNASSIISISINRLL